MRESGSECNDEQMMAAGVRFGPTVCSRQLFKAVVKHLKAVFTVSNVLHVGFDGMALCGKSCRKQSHTNDDKDCCFGPKPLVEL
jgi:hypothetical protein